MPIRLGQTVGGQDRQLALAKPDEQREVRMPRGKVPAKYYDLLTGRALGNLATVNPDGQPQVNPVWFISDGEALYLSIKPDTAKFRNVHANPGVAMSINDPENPHRYLELRGTVTEFEHFTTLVWVNELSVKYTGAAFTGGHDGESRYKVTVAITSWTAQD